MILVVAATPATTAATAVVVGVVGSSGCSCVAVVLAVAIAVVIAAVILNIAHHSFGHPAWLLLTKCLADPERRKKMCGTFGKWPYIYVVVV